MNELSRQDLANIKDLHDIWIAKEVAGYESEVVDLCTDDVKWLPPDGPPILGKEEVREYLTQQHVRVLAIDAPLDSVEGNGSIAYLITNYRTRYITEGHSDVKHEAKGTHLWILRNEDDVWRVAVVTWSSW